MCYDFPCNGETKVTPYYNSVYNKPNTEGTSHVTAKKQTFCNNCLSEITLRYVRNSSHDIL